VDIFDLFSNIKTPSEPVVEASKPKMVHPPMSEVIGKVDHIETAIKRIIEADTDEDEVEEPEEEPVEEQDDEPTEEPEDDEAEPEDDAADTDADTEDFDDTGDTDDTSLDDDATDDTDADETDDDTSDDTDSLSEEELAEIDTRELLYDRRKKTLNEAIIDTYETVTAFNSKIRALRPLEGEAQELIKEYKAQYSRLFDSYKKYLRHVFPNLDFTLNYVVYRKFKIGFEMLHNLISDLFEVED
jgi:hypothetical protein